MPMFGGYHGMGFFGGGFGMLLFWGVIIFAVVVLVRSLSRPSARSARDSALSIAAERYARGEISLEEYNVLKKNL